MQFGAGIPSQCHSILLAASVITAAFALPPTAFAEESHQNHSAHDEHAAHEGHAGQGTHPPGAEHGEHAGHDHSMDHSEHDGAHTAHAEGDDPHAHHRAMMSRKGYQRSEHQYELPDLELTAMSGEPTTLSAELDIGKPVMINFIFTTCTTICPVMSGTFAQVQSQLGPEADEVRMVSFSIDPEYDTPERLRAYAKQFGAGSQWQFLTGDLDSLISVQKAFDVYRGNKMNHEPTTLMRRSPGEPWVRLDGIASAAQIVAEYRQLVQR